MMHHIRTLRAYGLPVVVCLNRFHTDTDAEVQCINKFAKEAGAQACVSATHFAEGGKGALDLAKAVEEACSVPSTLKFT